MTLFFLRVTYVIVGNFYIFKFNYSTEMEWKWSMKFWLFWFKKDFKICRRNLSLNCEVHLKNGVPSFGVMYSFDPTLGFFLSPTCCLLRARFPALMIAHLTLSTVFLYSSGVPTFARICCSTRHWTIAVQKEQEEKVKFFIWKKEQFHQQTKFFPTTNSSRVMYFLLFDQELLQSMYQFLINGGINSFFGILFSFLSNLFFYFLLFFYSNFISVFSLFDYVFLIFFSFFVFHFHFSTFFFKAEILQEGLRREVTINTQQMKTRKS